MSSTTVRQCIFVVLLVMSSSDSTDLFRRLNKLMSILLAGCKLSTVFFTSFGTKYPPIEEDVTFWCVPPKGRILMQTYMNDPDIHSKLDLNFPVNFVVHGWLGGLDGVNRHLTLIELEESDGWMRTTTTTWANVGNCNVCSVDWSRLSNYDYAIAATVNTNLVAKYMTEFMNFLIMNGMDVRRTAIGGHSLGAEIAGKVGRYYHGIIAAIFGMDPAGPGFTMPWDRGAGHRLSDIDAQYVQCIQTASGTLGTHKDCGRGSATFIINGGIKQPGCLTVFCSHSRAHAYFNEAMLEGHIFAGKKCTGRIHYFLSKVLGMHCSMESEQLGIHAEGKPGRFFIKTNAAPPFAKNT